MIYNKFQDLELSRLGFGCMRFAKDPVIGEIDQEKVNEMFRVAIEGGVNYFDTAYPYLDGKSEEAMAKALAPYPRESYYVADKFPGHSLPGPVDNRALFEIELQRCGVDYFDFYLLHNVNEGTVDVYENEEYHILPDMLELKAQGKIRHLGFSCHGGPAFLEEFLTRHEGEFEFVQIQCNYLDWTLQHAKEKVDVISRHGLGVWVMESVRGGKLVNLPEAAQEKLRALDPQASMASWGFRFLQDLPNLKVILSGMNEVFQVEDNVRTFAEHKPLKEEETVALLEIAETLKTGVPCTGCRYCCKGCPMELDIPMLLECYNSIKITNEYNTAMRLEGIPEDKKPSACIACGQCAHACPQGIAVPETLAELTELFAAIPKWSDAVKSRQAAINKDLGR